MKNFKEFLSKFEISEKIDESDAEDIFCFSTTQRKLMKVNVFSTNQFWYLIQFD